MYDIRVNVYLVEKLHFSLSSSASASPSLICFVCVNSFKLTTQSTKCMSFILNLASFFSLSLYSSSSSLEYFFFFSTFIHFYSNPFLDEFLFCFVLLVSCCKKLKQSTILVNIPSICILHDGFSTLFLFLFSITKFRILDKCYYTSTELLRIAYNPNKSLWKWFKWKFTLGYF